MQVTPQPFKKQRELLSLSILCLHFGLQLAVAYWSTQIDGYTCFHQYLLNVTYFAYSLIVFNFILIGIANSRFGLCGDFTLYVGLLVQLGLIAGILYYSISGLLYSSVCAASRVLFEYYVIQSSITFFLTLIATFAKRQLSDLYPHWLSNLAWPILFLKWGYPSPLFATAIVIGVLQAILFISSAILHFLLPIQKKSPYLRPHWYFCAIAIIGTAITSIVMCCIYGKDGDYYWSYARKVFVAFAGVALLGVGGSGYGWWRSGHWGMGV